MKSNNLMISAAIISFVPFFACAPLWAGRINEKIYRNETEVQARGILAIQVSSPPSLKFENEAGQPIIG